MEMHHDMKKKAAAEALHELISQMMGMEGKKPEAYGEGVKAKMEEAGMTGVPEQQKDAMDADEDGELGMDQERKDFMSFKKKPLVEKSMTVVMAAPKGKFKKKGM